VDVIVKLKEKKNLILGALVLFIVGGLIGRYLAPEKIQIKVQEKEVIKEVIKYKESKKSTENKDKQVIIIETRLPDGTITKETRILDKGVVVVDVKKDLEDRKESSKETKTEITKDSPKDWNIAALATPSHLEDSIFATGSLAYGLHVQRRIIGPFQLGAFGITNKTYGFSIGASW
jgi:hypothetical protein